MQWLIDLIIEAIGIPPVFIDRGDPETTDFGFTHFNQDGNWHELDLSDIVPAGASAVAFWFDGFTPTVESAVTFRKDGNAFVGNVCTLISQVANVLNMGDFVCPIGADRKLEYHFSTPDWDFMGLVVKGWWL